MNKILQPPYWIFALLLSCLACQMQQEVEVTLPPHQQALVVECYLEPGEPYRALVTHTTSFYEETTVAAVDTAEVYISTASEEAKKLYAAQSIDTGYNKVFNYWHPEEVLYEEGKEYQLSVSVNGEVKATGRTRFLPKPSIKKVEIKFQSDSMAAVYVHIEDNTPEEENYYRILLRGTDTKAGATYDGTWTDEEASNGTIVAYTPADFKRGWHNVVLNVYHIDEKYYNFLQSMQQARDANYNPFMQPATIKSTLDGATGVFTAVSLASDTIAIE